MSIGAIIVWLAELWLWAGAAVAVVFLLVGIGRVDDSARGSYTFRPLLVPGVLLLWPLVLMRWYALETADPTIANVDKPLRDAHAWVWALLAILIPVILATSLLIRQAPPSPADGAVRLQPPQSQAQ